MKLRVRMLLSWHLLVSLLSRLRMRLLSLLSISASKWCLLLVDSPLRSKGLR
uniref:Uncharacterized protein n=1 Tax=Lotus japonicus TaxID=34305 RepID=I3SQJ8_LOTJA|nr:unknown [Lotus japonicus]